MSWVSEAIGSFFFSLAVYRIVMMMFGVESTLTLNVNVSELQVTLRDE